MSAETVLIVKTRWTPERGAARLRQLLPDATVAYRPKSSTKTQAKYTVRTALTLEAAVAILAGVPGIYEIREGIVRSS